MNWLELKSESDLAELISKSFESKLGVAIFKHSTRCSISFLAKKRLESSWSFGDELPIYYLDLLSHRNISDEIVRQISVKHESPQLIVVKDGNPIYDASHLSISVSDIKN